VLDRALAVVIADLQASILHEHLKFVPLVEAVVELLLPKAMLLARLASLDPMARKSAILASRLRCDSTLAPNMSKSPFVRRFQLGLSHPDHAGLCEGYLTLTPPQCSHLLLIASSDIEKPWELLSQNFGFLRARP